MPMKPMVLSEYFHDTLVEFLFCCCPFALTDKTVLRGILHLCDEETRYALNRERHRLYVAATVPSRN